MELAIALEFWRVFAIDVINKLYVTFYNMVKYLKTNATSKAGVNYVRAVVDSHNCIFQKIDQENDVGIDALIEVVRDERPTGNFIAAQIKSGKSFFDKKAKLCKLPIGKHREYWKNYSLPVYGFVFIPEFESAYWVDIKKYLKDHPTSNVISFEPTLVNILNKNTFITQFIPLITGEIPIIDYDLAKQLFTSSNHDEVYLGLYTLFKKYADKNEIWDLFVGLFQKHSVEEIPGRLVYYLSVIPWHPDLFFFKDTHTPESREYGKTLIKKFGKEEIFKLLHFVDDENMISRGSLGQSVEAIISIIPNFLKYLEDIIVDNNIEIILREVAAVIYAYHRGKKSINILEKVPPKESWYIPEIIKHLEEFEEFDPYL